jgi:hypothetical protein
VTGQHTISWSIQPHRKSLNFGIFKHPGNANGNGPPLPSSSSTVESGLEIPTTRPRGASTSRNDRTLVFEKLSAIGLKQVHWHGKCEADHVSMGTYNVPQGEGGMYGLVFDNTFSKTISKTATLVLMTYPTNAPPKSGHHMHYAQAHAGASSTSLSKSVSPPVGPAESSESLPTATADRPRSANGNTSSSSSFFTGFLQKKRRKRNQGYARRFFSLDFTSSTLSYYRNDHSSALRGAIPLSLAAIGANGETREISVDSGAEIWQLRANNAKDFDMWRDALDRASRSAAATASPTLQIKDSPYENRAHTVDPAEAKEWAAVEALVGRIAGMRDTARRLAQETDPKYGSAVAPSKPSDSLSPSPSETEGNDYFPEASAAEKKAFWKRKASNSGGQSPSGLFRRSVSAQVGVASPGAIPPVPPLPANGSLAVPKRNARLSQSSMSREEGVHDHCMALLRDLDSVTKDFTDLIDSSKQRRTPVSAPPMQSRHSIDSFESTDEFFDATDGGGGSKSQLLTIRRDSEDVEQEREPVHDGDEDGDSDDGSESSSEHEAQGVIERARFSIDQVPALFPTKPTSLSPLPLEPVKRRAAIQPPKTQPPSLIAFLRKNVGKDLSTIAMPVSSNEPTSGLQRLAEQLEYSELLDAAAGASAETGERLIYMAAFAISCFSSSRVKERAARKPFNPMLGETFELVREDKGFRFISEKVVHRPVRMACQAEAEKWTFVQSPTPVQKFWGKSAELNTDGRVRIFLHASGEHYSWTTATSYLRNVIAGEKYIEPSGTMTIVCESTGAKATCTFKAGGMFAGRSEEVSVQVHDASGALLPLGAAGKWTSELHFTNNNQPTDKTVWKAGALVPAPEKHYGFTTFAAALNDLTAIEDGHVAPTDSRLRPDQRALEDGDLDSAEALKARLEERQRARRRVLEEHGEEYHPRWFTKVEDGEGVGLDGEEVWRLKSGKEGYWECREKGEWGDVDVFQT